MRKTQKRKISQSAGRSPGRRTSRSASRSASRSKSRSKSRSASRKEEDDCPICLESLANGEETATTKCNHVFHKNCIVYNCEAMFWSKKKTCLCPLCRRPIGITDLSDKISSVVTFDRRNLTEETFPLYLNHTLSSKVSENPEPFLHETLDDFSGEDTLPEEVYFKVMEFKKLHVSTTRDRKKKYTYMFNGFVKKIPFFRGNNKYYRFSLTEDGIQFAQNLKNNVTIFTRTNLEDEDLWEPDGIPEDE